MCPPPVGMAVGIRTANAIPTGRPLDRAKARNGAAKGHGLFRTGPKREYRDERALPAIPSAVSGERRNGTGKTDIPSSGRDGPNGHLSLLPRPGVGRAFAFRTDHDGPGIFQRARSASGAFRMKRINRKRKSAGGVHTGAGLKFPIEISGRVFLS